jgi:Tfp pilus assembly PilM family ATPase
MARILALEFNDVQARLVVASSRGDRALVEHAFCVPFEPAEPREGSEPPNPGQRIAAALAARGIGRLDTFVAVGRTQIELRQISVPPSPADELPDLVRFQAMKEFNALKEDWPLDFVPLDDQEDGPRNVLAATIDPALVDEIGKTCEPAGLKPRRLILRPCATASLWRRSRGAGDSQARLLVDLLDDEAELTVVVDRKDVFLRSTRLPNDPLTDPEALKALLAEIRRTMGATRNQLGGQRVEAVVLCGDGPGHKELAGHVQEHFSVPVELFDPFAGMKLSGEALRSPPEDRGRFAALLGMVLDEFQHVSPAVDFLHPRRRPIPTARRNAYALGGLAAALLVLAVVCYSWYARSSMRTEIRDLSAESLSLDKQLAAADKKVKAAKEVGEWIAEDAVWLDELRWLVEKLPSSENAMLTKVTLRSTSGGGEISVDGFARSVDIVKEMERNLRDASHGVVGKDKSDDPSQKPYGLRFSSSVVIQRGKP